MAGRNEVEKEVLGHHVTSNNNSITSQSGQAAAAGENGTQSQPHSANPTTHGGSKALLFLKQQASFDSPAVGTPRSVKSPAMGESSYDRDHLLLGSVQSMLQTFKDDLLLQLDEKYAPRSSAIVDSLDRKIKSSSPRPHHPPSSAAAIRQSSKSLDELIDDDASKAVASASASEPAGSKPPGSSKAGKKKKKTTTTTTQKNQV